MVPRFDAGRTLGRLQTPIQRRLVTCYAHNAGTPQFWRSLPLDTPTENISVPAAAVTGVIITGVRSEGHTPVQNNSFGAARVQGLAPEGTSPHACGDVERPKGGILTAGDRQVSGLFGAASDERTLSMAV